MTEQDHRQQHRHGTKVSDDGTQTFFYRAHTIIALVITILTLTYVTFAEDTAHENDWEYNTKRGIFMMIFVFLAFGVTQTRDGPFTRPHPAIWRLVLCLGVVYQLGLVFLLFQSATNARKLFTYLDKDLDVAPNFTAYGHECEIYDRNNPEDPFHNVKHKLDGFVVAHFIGWVLKALIIRDFWMANIISVLFELLEYTFEHQLPNFSECWWDHWILDALICNFGGIVVGFQIMKYLKNKSYNWRGLCKQKTMSAKATRMIAQFTPYSWVSFHWNFTKSLRNWLFVTFIIVMYSLTELNTFYLKFVLWLPAGHWIVLTRMWGYVFWGGPATREMYDYMIGWTTEIGQHFWVYMGCVLTEVLIVIKFGEDLTINPMPTYVKVSWAWGIVAYIMWSFWKYQVEVRIVTPGSPEARKASLNGEIDVGASLPRLEMLSGDDDSCARKRKHE